MPVRRCLLALAVAAAATACGRLASGSYQAPALATVRGVLTFPVDAPARVEGDHLRVLLIWQSAAWPPLTEDVWWQEEPFTPEGGTPPGLPAEPCPPPSEACGWSGAVTCSVRRAFHEEVGSVPYLGPLDPLEFEVPIASLPPAGARRSLGRGGADGTLAIGQIVFELVHASAVAGGVVASSAYNGRAGGATSESYRTSYFLTHLQLPPGAPAVVRVPGLSEPLRPGFGLVVKLEREGGPGRLLPVGLTPAAAGARVRLTGRTTDERRWCDVFTVREVWESRGYMLGATRCSATVAAFACDRVTNLAGDGCSLQVQRYVAETACLPAPGRCPSRTFTTEALPDDREPPGALQALEDFQLLPSDAVLSLGGGAASPGEATRTGLYHAATHTWWMPTPLTYPRTGAAVTELASGEVLVSGGGFDDDASRTAELLEPSTGTWHRTGSMSVPRTGHTATLLGSGEVLVTGGQSEENPGGSWSAERFDPFTGTWAPFAMGTDGPLLAFHSALQLASGEAPVLLTGSLGGPETFLCSPRGGCRRVGPMGVAHPGGTFTLLPSGKVLALGGRAAPASAETFDPETEGWSPVTPMLHGRSEHSAALLPDGRVLVAGGLLGEGGSATFLAETELYDPAKDRWEATGALRRPRSGLSLVVLKGGEVLVLGGVDETGEPLPVERYCP